MTVIQAILAFLVAIGPLIIFHELGHYTVARLCGVKVLRFSLGIGKVVWSRRFGPDQTEWAISMLPLGGYVKMLDNRDPETAAKTEEEAKREFTRQSVWRRIAIVAAGPLANFILAIVVFAGLYMHGIPDVSTRLRFAPEASAVYQAGLRAGDRIEAVNEAPVAAWDDLRLEIMKAALNRTDLRLEVAQAGGGRFSAVLPAATFASMKIEDDVMGELGLAPERSPALIETVIAGGPAERAGLKDGDVVTAIGDKPVRDGIEMIQAIRASNGQALALQLTRAGQPMTLTLKPVRDPSGQAWVINAKVNSVPEMVTVPAGPIDAIAKGARATWDHAAMQVQFIGKMITGHVSVKNVTGMITIADYAEQTARAGLIPFLRFIALISISLGVMNLLPIPVLDGGHLLYYSLEVLTGRPLPERINEIAQRVGVAMLVMLMALALFNDVDRLLQ